MSEMIRQGDVLLVPSVLPAGAEIQPERSGVRIVGERGDHVHILEGQVALYDGRTYVFGGGVLRHEDVVARETPDTTLHGPHQTDPIWYEVRQQREHVPLSASTRRWD